MHYHYHVSFVGGNVRQLDCTPWTTPELAQAACARYFSEEEKPQVIQVDATHICQSCQSKIPNN